MPDDTSTPLLWGPPARKGRAGWPYAVLALSLLAAVVCFCTLHARTPTPRQHAQGGLGTLLHPAQAGLDVLNSTELAPFVTALQLTPAKLHGRMKAVKVMNGTLSDALQELTPCSGLIILVLGDHKPQRRLVSQPFLQVSPPNLIDSLVHAINEGAAGIEAVLGRHLFPLHVRFTDRLRLIGSSSATVPLDMDPLGQHPGVSCSTGLHMRPHVAYELSTGTLLVDDSLAGPLQHAPKVQAMLVSVAVAVLNKIAVAAQQATALGAANALAMVSAAGVAGLAAAFASTVPIWYCFACPIVLGLLAPLLINAGLGEAADAACKALALDDTECFDLFLGALGVGLMLALLAAFPIFKVCKLYECSHPKA